MTPPPQSVNAASDGVALEKTHHPTPDGVRVRFTLRSNRTETVRVHLTDPLPPGVDPEDVEYESTPEGEGWALVDDHATYTGHLEPDVAVTARYTITTPDPHIGLQEPRLEVATPSHESSRDSDAPDPERDLAESLAAELRRDAVDHGTRAELQHALFGDITTPGDRLDRLEARLETLQGHASALATFLDENGTAQSILDDYTAALEALRDDHAALRDRFDTLDERTQTNQAAVSRAESRASDLRDATRSVEENRRELTRAAAQVDELAETVERLRAETARMRSLKSELSSALSDQ